jgi:hypothetical protein
VGFKLGAAGGIAIVGGGTLGYFFLLRPWLQKQAMKAELNKDQASTVTGPKLKTIGGQPVSGINLATTVVSLNKALHPGWWDPTHQKEAVRVFKTIPFGNRAEPGKYVKQVEKMYLEKYDENLQQVMADKLGDVEWMKVKFWFE